MPGAPRRRKEISDAISAPFGAENRSRLIKSYFDTDSGGHAEAWKHVYRLLLWIDATTGLAHCYESDKSQPGKHWYPRSLSFHSWLSEQLHVAPAALGETVDWLFRRATIDLVRQVLRRQESVLARARSQRSVYADKGLPEPGEDPELVAVIREVLGGHVGNDIPAETWRELVQRIRQHIALENKRKNLVGEGFEDVLAAVITRITRPGVVDAQTRRQLHQVPGFANTRVGEKVNKVDLVIVQAPSGRRMLVTAKWSIRADREKQFPAEFSAYVSAKSDNRPWDYVLITNEFDAARIVRACELPAANAFMFASVVHINPLALIATYGAQPEASMKRVVAYIESGRLIGLDAWIAQLDGGVRGA